MKRRSMAALGAAVVLVTAMTACQWKPGRGGSLGKGNGFVDEKSWTGRQDGYLRFATTQLDRGSSANLTAHLERARRDRSYDFDDTQVKAEDYASVFAKIDAYQDTSDFDMMRLTKLWWGYRNQLDPGLVTAIEQRFRTFRYWYTDPKPADVVDHKWFWSENHRLIFHTLEYLAGRALPEATFAETGEPGTVHAERGRERINAWLDEKARYGFSEWHSDVYYAKDIEPLLLLTEYAEKPIARRAAAMLDVFLYDLALHQLKGNNGVTHGRSYSKDKTKATDEDVFNVTKVAFATTSKPYQSRGDATAVALATARRYKLPRAIEQIARYPGAVLDREHMNVPIDIDQPLTGDPVSAVPGHSYTDPDSIPFWWERGALTAWPVVPLTLDTIDQHDLWKSELFAPFQPLADITGGDRDVARQLAYGLKCQINIGLLHEVDTVTWRSRRAMLSSAQDYRPGCFGDQYHAWQATLDEDAIVFTNMPGNEPRPAQRWDDGDYYWNGGVTMPRSAQQGPAVINLYAPQYAAAGGILSAFDYLPYTHAYFPTERFDEIRRAGGWTFGKRGDGYVALWSWRPTEWREHDPAETFTNGLTQRFDLVAPGGANNVWISQVGDAAHWKTFDAFVAALSSAPITVTDLGTANGVSKGFDVTFRSPTEGAMHLAWTGPFTVKGTEVPLHRTDRFANRFGTTPFGSTDVAIDNGTTHLRLDLLTGERVATLDRKRR